MIHEVVTWDLDAAMQEWEDDARQQQEALNDG